MSPPYFRRGFLISFLGRALADPRTFTISPPRGRPVSSLTEGHVKVMLAYGYSLSHGHQGFMPFTTDHIEAAQPMGAAVDGVEVLCEHQTVPT